MNGKLLGVIRGGARWYLRRGRFARILIFTLIFILPMLIYVHVKVSQERVEMTHRLSKNFLNNSRDEIELYHIQFLSLTNNKTVFYIGNTFEMYGDNLYKINSTHYIYKANTDTFGLLVNLEGNTTGIFILTVPVNMKVNGYDISRMTILLPTHNPPKVNSTLIKKIICQYVGDTDNPYKAYKENKLTLSYREICP